MSALQRISLFRRIVQASITNQIARYAPDFYVRLTKQTGRGAEYEDIGEVGDYFQTCFDDYFEKLGVKEHARADFLRGKRILEYGPGDVPGVAILMIAHGAEQVVCVDRFQLVRMSEKNVRIVKKMLDRLPQPLRNRAEACFKQVAHPESGFNAQYINYLVRPSGLSGLANSVDLVISRAVLEHVNDLQASFQDMYAALKPGGTAIHLVDLKSHGLHRSNPLDFLSWSPWLWSLMYSAKGVPNRLRVNTYRQVVAQSGLQLISLIPTVSALPTDVCAVRPSLAKPFRTLTDEDLSCLGFWLVCRKPAAQ